MVDFTGLLGVPGHPCSSGATDPILSTQKIPRSGDPIVSTQRIPRGRDPDEGDVDENGCCLSKTRFAEIIDQNQDGGDVDENGCFT